MTDHRRKQTRMWHNP